MLILTMAQGSGDTRLDPERYPRVAEPGPKR
jgi:hypothetical protein